MGIQSRGIQVDMTMHAYIYLIDLSYGSRESNKPLSNVSQPLNSDVSMSNNDTTNIHA